MSNVRGQQLVLVVEAASGGTDDRGPHAPRHRFDRRQHGRVERILDVGLRAHRRVEQLPRSDDEQRDQQPDRRPKHRVSSRSRCRLGSALGLVDEQRLTRVQRLEHLQLLELPVELGGRFTACLARTDLLDRGVDRAAVDLRAPGRVRGGDGVDGLDRVVGLPRRRLELDDVVRHRAGDGVAQVGRCRRPAPRALGGVDVQVGRVDEVLLGFVDASRIPVGRADPERRRREVGAVQDDPGRRLVVGAFRLTDHVHRDDTDEDGGHDGDRRAPQHGLQIFDSAASHRGIEPAANGARGRLDGPSLAAVDIGSSRPQHPDRLGVTRRRDSTADRLHELMIVPFRGRRTPPNEGTRSPPNE